MTKAHKVSVVHLLEEAGLFVVRDSVERTAAALNVSRFSIYNYINEVRGQTGAAETEGTGAS